MTDSLPTVWKIEAHTTVKHAILRRYFQAWLPILTQQGDKLQKRVGIQKSSSEVLYIDGFAGPGEYAGKEPGSPIVAMREAIDRKSPLPLPIRMLFVEHRLDRFEHLSKVVAAEEARAKASNLRLEVNLKQGDCDSVLNSILDESEKRSIKFGPALAFLDQFGYGAVSMNLIKRILSFGQCEVFTYLSYKEMNRWIIDDSKAEPFNRAFGGEEWRTCVPLAEKERRNELLRLYKAALKEKAGAKYVVSFLMYDKDNRPLYWLLFCTNNIRGLEEMKKAMWNVDKNGEFRFSDKDQEGQLPLLDRAFDQNWLADELKSRLSGRRMSVKELKEFVLTDTPCYLFRDGLRALETANSVRIVKAPQSRKPGTFPEEVLADIHVHFEKSLF
jgi:three-Cys-motif partner protein